MCIAAYEKKLFSIGFSAHAPIEKKTGLKSHWHINDDTIDEYVKQVLAAKKRWQGKLEVFLGFEVDYIKGLRSAVDNDIKAIKPDYLIGSLHYVVPANGTQPFTIDGSMEEFEKGLNEGFNGDADALMNCYYDAMAEMISTGGFDILGHADLIKKNCQFIKMWPQANETNRQAEIANAVSKTGITAEVNTGGINRGKTSDVYPSLSFLHLLNECNVPVIITSDAHRASDINGNYDTALQTLICAGFKNHVIFYGRDNNKPIWYNEKI